MIGRLIAARLVRTVSCAWGVASHPAKGPFAGGANGGLPTISLFSDTLKTDRYVAMNLIAGVGRKDRCG